jgi:hypothetical protein
MRNLDRYPLNVSGGTYPDGRTEDIKANAGAVQHMDAFTHPPENLGKTPFEVIAVELKR